jgi:hypothetical protein
MAIPVRTQMIRSPFLGLIALAGALGIISCAAAEDRHRGPVEDAPGRQRAVPASSGTNKPSSPKPTVASSATARPPAGPQDVQAWPCGAKPGRYLADLPPDMLSQHVPDQACSGESECGDGFCDRGRCAPIWENWYGQQCTMTCQCGPFLCLEGRCSSCLYHTECGGSGHVCSEYGLTKAKVSFGCGGVLGMRETHMPPEPVRPPPPPSP